MASEAGEPRQGRGQQVPGKALRVPEGVVEAGRQEAAMAAPPFSPRRSLASPRRVTSRPVSAASLGSRVCPQEGCLVS